MNIHWPTVLIQIINFIVLLYILKKFLYQRVLTTIANREEAITATIQKAKTLEDSAQAKLQEYNEQLKQAKFQADDIKNQAIQSAQSEHAEILQRYQDDANTKLSQYKVRLTKLYEYTLNELSLKLLDNISNLSKRAINDLTNTSLEEHALTIFLKKIAGLSAQEIADIKDSIKQHNAICLFSATELSRQIITSIEVALQKILDIDLALSTNIDASLLWGYTLNCGDFELKWNANAYMHDLQSQLKVDFEMAMFKLDDEVKHNAK